MPTTKQYSKRVKLYCYMPQQSQEWLSYRRFLLAILLGRVKSEISRYNIETLIGFIGKHFY